VTSPDPVIRTDPDVLGGPPVFAGTREQYYGGAASR
jgi:uncharacterized protein (DUF433 family)